ncbi:MAG: flavodoxin family protein [Sedimentisphaerales bacterium]|nr:flavodoxin family protein [Sedimentisphaerales bacterium]
MAKELVIYYSKTGNTKQMAEVISEFMDVSGGFMK